MTGVSSIPAISHIVKFSEHVNDDVIRTYLKKTPTFISKRFLRSLTRKVAMLEQENGHKVLISFNEVDGFAQNHVLVKCYDLEKNNRSVQVDTAFKLNGRVASQFAANLMDSHGLEVNTLTFVISLPHHKLFAFSDSTMKGDFANFTGAPADKYTYLDDTIKV